MKRNRSQFRPRLSHFSILASSILILSLNQSLNSMEQHHILRRVDGCSVCYVNQAFDSLQTVHPANASEQHLTSFFLCRLTITCRPGGCTSALSISVCRRGGEAHFEIMSHGATFENHCSQHYGHQQRYSSIHSLQHILVYPAVTSPGRCVQIQMPEPSQLGPLFHSSIPSPPPSLWECPTTLFMAFCAFGGDPKFITMDEVVGR